MQSKPVRSSSQPRPERVTKSIWASLDRLMRKLHLWTGLLLVPWMLVYAVSALVINHHAMVARVAGTKPPTWEHVRSVDFVPDDSFPTQPKEQAKVLLAKVNLEGAHRVQGKPNQKQLVVIRIRASGHYRVTWRKQQQRILVERQTPFSMLRLVHFLHFRAGYQQPVGGYIAWAVIVDFVVFSLFLWVISGIYLWSRMKRQRLSGGICLAAGCGLFVVLVLLLCQ